MAITETWLKAQLNKPRSKVEEFADRDGMSVHDLRLTMRTSIASLTEPHIAEVMIGHAIPKIWRTYGKHDYLEEKALAYNKWVDILEFLWGSNV